MCLRVLFLQSIGFFGALIATTAEAPAADIIVPQLPANYAVSHEFTLKAGGKGIPVVGYCRTYDYVQFEMTGGPCEIEITRLDGQPANDTKVSPLKFNIPVAVKDSTIRFIIDKPDYYIVDFPNQRRLVLIIDPPVQNPPPMSGPGIFNITADPYKADPTGLQQSGPAVQKAVDDAASSQTPGIVVVPPGVYRVNELRLSSNTNLYLATGAVLIQSGEHTLRYHKDSLKRDGTWFLYTDLHAKNIKIWGHGTLDGDGQRLVETKNLLNQILQTLQCSNFLIDGPILRDSALWGTIIGASDNVIIQNTKHLNRHNLPEDDGIDICNSSNVLVKHVLAISQDDSFSTKCWGEPTDLTRRWGIDFLPNKNITFEDCLAWTGCFAFKLGEGFFRNQENITFKNCVVFDAAHGIGLSAFWGSANLKNVLFDNIDIERNTRSALGCSWARFVIRKPIQQETGTVASDITVRNFLVRDKGRDRMQINGLSDSKQIIGLHFENIQMPGQPEPARTLEELNAELPTKFSQDITVSPTPQTQSPKQIPN